MSRPPPNTDVADLDGMTPLSEGELRRLRKLLLDDDRATWLRKQIRILLPVVVTAVAAIWGVWEWASKHIRWAS